MATNDPFDSLYKQLAHIALQHQQSHISGRMMIGSRHAASSGTISGSANAIGGLAGSTMRPSYPFDTNDRVVLISGTGYMKEPEDNPVWGREGNYIAGTVRGAKKGGRMIMVHFDDGRDNMFDLDECEFKHLSEAPAPKMLRKMKLNTAPLDALVISESTRDEIIAVLKQHQNADKIFKEWGLAETIEYGKGMTFMFHGPPGTGKTWGATCIAKALGTSLLTISAAEIQSSEPGGANRSIQQAFETAAKEGKVLFIDECDSLIANRADLGMILSSEVNTLLTEIEKFEGVLILATNMIGNMDAALERRISMIVEFPMPDFENRKKIWGKLLPKKFPLAEDVKVEDLAKEEFSGGQIKNVILQSARLAVAGDSKTVTLEHFNTAIKRVLSSKGVMGTNNRYDQRNRGVGVQMGNGQVGKFLERSLEIDEEKGV